MIHRMGSAKPFPFDPRTATASDLQALLRASKVTSVQLVKVYLKQIEQYNGYLKAVISTAPESALLDEAEKLDAERGGREVRSSLHGIPILIKASSRCMETLPTPC